MNKAKTRITKRPIKALIGISLITSGLWVSVFNVLSNIETGSQAEVIVINKVVIKEVEKISDYVPSSNTLKIIEAKPGIYGAIYRKWGNEARQYAELIARESGFNEYAINVGSGACGLGQFLPCSKLKCDLSDVDCQLDAIEEYVVRRYGTIERALVFHDVMGWY